MPAATNLKISTQEAHQRAEEALDAAAIRNGTYTRSAYLGLLRANRSTWAAVADWFAQNSALHRPEEDFSYIRELLAEIDHDLILMGATATGTTESAESPFPNYHPATALGLLYVLKGSTLGGAMLGRWFPQSPELADVGAFNFYAACGRQPAGHWKIFQNRLNKELSEQASLEMAIRAARITFDHLHDAMRSSNN